MGMSEIFSTSCIVNITGFLRDHMARKRQKTPVKEISAEAFLYGSRRYCRAANILIKSENYVGNIDDPIYILYFHAMELLLKAFLRKKGVATSDLKFEYTHNLTRLYDKSIDLGLMVPRNRSLEVKNVISGLHSSNNGEGLRYFTYESTGTVELKWVGEIVNLLLELVLKSIDPALFDENRPAGPAVKLSLMLMRPTLNESPPGA